MRIGPDPGTPLFGIGVAGADFRHHYHNDEPFNKTQTLMWLENKSSYGGSPSYIFLDGMAFTPLFGVPSNFPYQMSGSQIWVNSKVHANEMIVAGWPGNKLYWFDVMKNKITRTFSLPFSVYGIGLAYGVPSNNSRYVLLQDKVDSSGNMHIFVVDMDPQSPYPPYPNYRIGPIYNVNDGLNVPGLKPHWASISSSGKYILLHYSGDHNRVFEVDSSTLTIRPHPVSASSPHCAGTTTNGDIYDLGHLDLGSNPFDNDEDVISGQEHCGQVGQNVPGVQTVNENGIGHVVMVRLRDGATWSLTDPGNGNGIPKEAYAYHISLRALDRPGWAYVSYYKQDGMRYSDETIAVKMNGSGFVERYVHQHSDSENKTGNNCNQLYSDFDYLSEPHSVPSWDGKKIIFGSNWLFNGSGGGCSIQDYVIKLPVVGRAGIEPATP